MSDQEKSRSLSKTLASCKKGDPLQVVNRMVENKASLTEEVDSSDLTENGSRDSGIESRTSSPVEIKESSNSCVYSSEEEGEINASPLISDENLEAVSHQGTVHYRHLLDGNLVEGTIDEPDGAVATMTQGNSLLQGQSEFSADDVISITNGEIEIGDFVCEVEVTEVDSDEKSPTNDAEDDGDCDDEENGEDEENGGDEENGNDEENGGNEEYGDDEENFVDREVCESDKFVDGASCDNFLGASVGCSTLNSRSMAEDKLDMPKNPVCNGDSKLRQRSNLKRKAEDEAEDAIPSKMKRRIQFDGVTVFYFPRSQGFTCVPSQGGSTLGMSRRHSHVRRFSLSEHSVEQKRSHRQFLVRLRQQRSAREQGEYTGCSSEEESEENSEETSDISDSELDMDSYYFLQPLPIRQRRLMLRQCGIRQIETTEKEECKDIRVSREMCGCQCRVYCDPETCACSVSGVKCQVDRHNFPCGCSREGCGNVAGRVEFNPIRVRTHFIHTLMRLEIEKRQQQPQHHWLQPQRPEWLAAHNGAANVAYYPQQPRSENCAVGSNEMSEQKFSSGEMLTNSTCATYPHFSCQNLPSSEGNSNYYLQHETVSDFPSTSCSMFGRMGSSGSFQAPYHSCFSNEQYTKFPSQGCFPTATYNFPSSSPDCSYAFCPAPGQAPSLSSPYVADPMTLHDPLTHGPEAKFSPHIEGISTLTGSIGGSHLPSVTYPALHGPGHTRVQTPVALGADVACSSVGLEGMDDLVPESIVEVVSA